MFYNNVSTKNYYTVSFIYFLPLNKGSPFIIKK